MEGAAPYEEESIYKIIPAEVPPPVKPPVYRSKHSPFTCPTASTFGLAQTSKPGVNNLGGSIEEPAGSNHHFSKGGATFGKSPGLSRPDQYAFLKKQTHAKPIAPLRSLKETAPEKLQPSQLKKKLRPPVPAANDKPVMNLVSDKNFITANAVDVILAPPRRRLPPTQDFLKKADYGMTPDYLHKVKQDIANEYEYVRKLHEEELESRNQQLRLMGEEEKEALIRGFKAKWEQVNREYQAMSHQTKLDTVGKIKRKEHFESLLGQIEKDLEKLNRKHIFVDATC
ncbi:unnamed protein product [Vitrella brassicaformis CCMP3155]|uniref:Enkurin domain-containing protein n=1 Tax=Vitrella brassicaformis (strain CCMP3155) TaxID=1169540 RepID=A0A0G4GTD3_VITBC|nr:unnamed protein product [Vitrella brassicaformis CCMP3155]|eukprot:CEM33745.1 unnamed protein product [Vitrella brassicaformis CCMP3155]